MSASIYSLLADELDISEEKAQKLLSAMLREVKKRARKQDDGVQLPELGQFTTPDGTLTFSPSDSLARAVNHRFEGLEPEDLTSAPGNEEEQSDQDTEGPSTITLGYQAGGNFGPIDNEDETDASDSESDDAPDTAEFEAPTTNGDDGADTDEFEAPDADDTPASPEPEPASERPPAEPASSPPNDLPDSDESTPESPAAEASDPSPASEPETAPASETADADSDGGTASPQKTEELYPFVEDVPGSSSPADSPDDPDASDETDEPSPAADDPNEVQEQEDDLSGIWDEVEQETQEMPAPTSSTEPEEQTDDSEPEPSPSRDASAPSAPEDSSTEESSTSDSDTPSESASPDADRTPSKEPADRRTAPSRIIAAVLAFLLLGSGAWYILGLRGMMPGPATTFSALKARVASDVQAEYASGSSTDSGLPEAAKPTPSPDADASSDSSEASKEPNSGSASDPSAPTSSESEEPTSTDAPTETDSEAQDAATETDADDPAPETPPSSPPTGITPSEGGWSIIVASRGDRNGAEKLVASYRDRLGNQQVPIDILEATVDNSTRYRVGVGQFSARGDAQRFLEQQQSELPDGAWILKLQ